MLAIRLLNFFHANARTGYMTLSQYLGRGQTSRGRATIKSDLTMTVSTVPWGQDPNDALAVIKGVENLVAALSKVANLTILKPPAGTSVADWVNGVCSIFISEHVNHLTLSQQAYDPGARRSNHWLGTNKIGTDDGRKGGTAVVDLNTKVYGTDNIFVVDASIFPGMPTTNPSALVVTVAERASTLILALPKNTAVARVSQFNWGQMGIQWLIICSMGSAVGFIIQGRAMLAQLLIGVFIQAFTTHR
jgi:cellobiose dehydrogenase (acceptor)